MYVILGDFSFVFFCYLLFASFHSFRFFGMGFVGDVQYLGACGLHLWSLILSFIFFLLHFLALFVCFRCNIILHCNMEMAGWYVDLIYGGGDFDGDGREVGGSV